MNIVRKIGRILRATAFFAGAVLCFSCVEKDENFGIKEQEGVSYKYPGNRIGHIETRRVLLFYECGFNSLYSYLADNMEDDLEKGYLPSGGRNEDVILIFSKLAKNANYKDVPSYLRRIYKNAEGKIVSDTLKTYPTSVVASSGETMRDVLSYVKVNFPAKGYGMVFSSHGSGWLPAGYYNNPTDFERYHRNSSGAKFSKRLSDSIIPVGNLTQRKTTGRPSGSFSTAIRKICRGC